MGGSLLPAGATFRVWAPAAREVRVLWDYHKTAGTWLHHKQARLVAMNNGRWAGFVPGLKAGERYMFHVTGPAGGTEGLKRDPYARDLTDDPMWPDCQCMLVDHAAFTWHDQGWRAPAFHELIRRGGITARFSM
jgi:1,4-alpha-glucan branching enzyme